jgi:hypothetical protein
MGFVARAWSVGTVFVVSGLVACSATSGNGDEAGPSAVPAGSGGASEGGAGGLELGGGGTGGLTAGCGTTCPSGSVCSVIGQCIPAGSCRADGDCSEGLQCDVASETCVPGGDCGQKPFAISAKAPELMIVLDRSGSMGKSVPGTGKSRWAVAADAIGKMLTKYDAKIDFGLSLFSACGSKGCMPGIVDAGIPSSSATISSKIAATSLCSSGKNETVIGGTLQALVGNPSLQVADRANVVVLITDGQDNCGGGGAAAAQALLGQPVPVATYVVGFSGDVNKSELTNIAKAAGTAPYFQADNATQLEAALDAITASVATCTFTLDQVPPSSGLWVFFDKDPTGVAQDAANGWTYDASDNSLTFHGTSCDSIKQGTVKDIDVIYACSKPTPV